MKKTAIVRCEHFNAAHRLHNHNWSDEKNKVIKEEKPVLIFPPNTC